MSKQVKPLNPADATIASLTTALQDDMLTSTTMFVDDLYWQGSGLVNDLLSGADQGRAGC